MNVIRTDNIKHQYDVWQGDEKFKRTALDGVDLDVKRGDFIAILGANGSGKSTLAKHLNVLLLPDEGTVWIDGNDTRDEKKLWEIRTEVGMVFQNPDNQIVGTSVEEDVAFGPENRNMEPVLIREKVANSLAAVGLLSKRKASPYRLSGGQKQRVAVAGVLAADSGCIVLDEPTAMLDPVSRRELMDVIHRLHDSGKTMILITHHTDEVVDADRIILMDKGRVVGNGTPAEILSDRELLRSIRMDLPPVTGLGMALKDRGVIDKTPVLGKEELISLVMEKRSSGGQRGQGAEHDAGHFRGEIAESETLSREIDETFCDPDRTPVISVKGLHFTYSKGEASETKVLNGVSFDLFKGECLGLIGTSGAGKTTLLKNLNGLLKAEQGDVLYMGESIYRKGYKLSKLRKSVGLVFQSAEKQLFCKSVLEDVKFGPLKMGMSEEEAQKAAEDSLALVDIGKEYFDASPQDLSGGQKRRVAIAGILAMQPDVLILDEPAAGLDPGMKEEIFSMIDGIRRERGTAVILVSHEMEDVAAHADRVMLMSDGQIGLSGTPKEVFSQVEKVRELGGDIPEVTDIMYELQRRGLPVSVLEVSTDEAADKIASALVSGAAGKGRASDTAAVTKNGEVTA